ncbi:hypothetical protein LJC10_02875 [Selenomonadales bacterium OttesenSCG-928-I06]|nr:hypothetical protein [Selenomonadales bacterium OttesenSCG-928-I06]
MRKFKFERLLQVLLALCLIVGVYYVWDEYIREPIHLKTSIESPDNKFMAYIYEKKGGTPTYHLSIIEKEQRLGNRDGNAVISYREFEVEWVKPGEVKVTFFTEPDQKEMIKNMDEIRDVTVTYSNLPPK